MLPGSSLPAALPPVSTDQPLSCGAPAAPLHQEISSQPQERQQQPRCDQGNQGLLGRAPVAPCTFLFEGFYSKLEEKKKKYNTKESWEWDKQEVFASAAQASNNAAPHLLGKLHGNRAGLQLCPDPGSPHVLTGSFPAWSLLWHREFCPLEHTPGSTLRDLSECCSSAIYTLRFTWGSAPRAKGSLRAELGGGIH